MSIPQQILSLPWKIPSLQEYRERVNREAPCKGGRRLAAYGSEAKPLISVITVTFNAGSTLERTLLSVPGGNPSLVEHLIIDGGSKDGTLALLEKYSDKIDFWISEPDKGIYDAMNKGIALANGEWILFLNADDLLRDKDILEIASERWLRLPRVDVIAGATQYFDGEHDLQIAQSVPDLMGKELCMNHTSTFIKSEVFERIGLYTNDFKIISDNEWFFRAKYMSDAKFLPISEVISRMNLQGFTDRRWVKACLELYRMRRGFGVGAVPALARLAFQIIRTYVRRRLQAAGFAGIVKSYRNLFSPINRHA